MRPAPPLLLIGGTLTSCAAFMPWLTRTAFDAVADGAGPASVALEIGALLAMSTGALGVVVSVTARRTPAVVRGLVAAGAALGLALPPLYVVAERPQPYEAGSVALGPWLLVAGSVLLLVGISILGSPTPARAHAPRLTRARGK